MREVLDFYRGEGRGEFVAAQENLRAIIDHALEAKAIPVTTQKSFAVTPEMRRIVGEGDQRLWGVGGIGLLGASAAARQRDEEPGLGGGLLAPYTGLLAEIGRE